MSEIKRRPDGSIDWEAIKSLLSAGDFISESDQLDHEHRQAILEARAHKLAQVPEQAPDTEQVLQILYLQLGNETFAIETKYVVEVLNKCSTVRLPDAPAFVVGVTNLRGEILAVMDLKGLFEIKSAEPANTSQVIVLGLEQVEFGVLADEVTEVGVETIKAVMPVPPSIAKSGRRFLRGVTSDAKLILDGKSLLECADFIVDLDG